MIPRASITICFGVGVLATATLLLAQSGGSLSPARARVLLQHLGGTELEKDRVRIKSVKPGVGGGGVIVEAQIDAAFRVTRDHDNWRVTDIRLGDREWESIELITEAVRREKIRRTTALLQQVAEALESYRRERGNYVVTDDAGVLSDHLAPRYLREPVRFDQWGAALVYHGTTSGFRLISAGP